MRVDFPADSTRPEWPSPFANTQRVLAAIGMRLRRLSFENFALAITLIGLARVGFSLVTQIWTASLGFASSGLPKASEIYLSSSLGPTLAYRIMGYPRIWVWVCVWASSVLLGYVLVVAKIHGLGEWSRPVLLIAVMSPAFAVSLHLIGIYDPLIVLGSLLVVCSIRVPLIVLGATLAVLGNPEQALASAICLVILGLSTRQSLIRRQGAIFATTASVGFLAIQVWQHASNVDNGRLELLLDLSGLTSDALRNFIQTAPLMVYSWLGPLWLVLAMALTQLSRRERLGASVAVLGIPAAVTVLTVDGTRVFALVSLASLAALGRHVFRRYWARTQPSDELLGGLLVMLLVFPSVVILMGGVTEPFIDLIRVVRDGL